MNISKRFLLTTVAIILSLGFIWYAGPWSQDTKQAPIPQATTNQVVAAIQSGTLKPDAKGVIILPVSLASASQNGKVYVTRNGPGATIVLFPEFLAGGWFTSVSNYEGRMYCNTPVPASCTITGPVLASPMYTRSGKWTAGDTQFEGDLLVKTSPNWYRVSTDNF